MRGDFTRDTFDPARHFSRVLMQQGRVQLDADWNEQTSILLHYLRTLASDILGPHAGPAGALGFQCTTRGTVAAWAANGLDPDEQWKAIEPDQGRRDVLRRAVESGSDAVIGPGRYYVQGVLVENPAPMLLSEQPGYPFSREMAYGDLSGREVLGYLDVWERHVTHVEHESIREVALGGADTCMRAQVVWQVKTIVRDDHDVFDCASVQRWLARAHTPTMKARARRGESSGELCAVSPESRYRGLENQLYRVEIHEVASAGGGASGPPATFKWARDNGSVVFPIVAMSGTSATLAHLGTDQCASLSPGDWVEVCDDERALRESSGPLARVQEVDRDELKVTLVWPSGVTELPGYPDDQGARSHPLLRRWDHRGQLEEHRGAVPVVEGTAADRGWIDIEDGVQVWFAPGGDYRVGDYWLIPARVATGDVEWPTAVDGNGGAGPDEPAARPPHGPRHYHAPLFHMASDGTMDDCRCGFAALTANC